MKGDPWTQVAPILATQTFNFANSIRLLNIWIAQECLIELIKPVAMTYNHRGWSLAP